MLQKIWGQHVCKLTLHFERMDALNASRKTSDSFICSTWSTVNSDSFSNIHKDLLLTMPQSRAACEREFPRLKESTDPVFRIIAFHPWHTSTCPKWQDFKESLTQNQLAFHGCSKSRSKSTLSSTMFQPNKYDEESKDVTRWSQEKIYWQSVCNEIINGPYVTTAAHSYISTELEPESLFHECMQICNASRAKLSKI